MPLSNHVNPVPLTCLIYYLISNSLMSNIHSFRSHEHIITLLSLTLHELFSKLTYLLSIPWSQLDGMSYFKRLIILFDNERFRQ